MVVDDQAFGQLVQRVEDMHSWMKGMQKDVKALTDAYNQAKGAAAVFSPFKAVAVTAVCSLLAAGAGAVIAKLI
jgi:phage-related protein